MKDFREVRLLAEKMKLFDSNFVFFTLQFLQLFVFELIAWMLFYHYGIENWIVYMAAVVLLVTTQVILFKILIFWQS
jgi:hypothetical protein